jgi:TPR repeat protein
MMTTIAGMLCTTLAASLPIQGNIIAPHPGAPATPVQQHGDSGPMIEQAPQGRIPCPQSFTELLEAIIARPAALSQICSCFSKDFMTACQAGNWEACGFVAMPTCAPTDCLERTAQKTQAARLLKRGCSRGVGAACFFLGSYHLATGGNRETVGPLLERACSGGVADGCYWLAGLRKSTSSTALDATVLPLYEKACTLSRSQSLELTGCLEAAAIHAAHPDGLERAGALYETACQAGLIEGCNAGSTVLALGGQTTRALKLLERACHLKGGDDSCLHLAFAYRSGTLLERDIGEPDLIKAAEAAATACGRSHPQACVFAGKWMAEGRGDAEGQRVREGFFAIAIRIWTERCIKGDGSSCLQLSNEYHNGDLVDRDGDLADWYARRACEHGVGDKCEQPSHP